ncbi:MAG: pyridoxal-phosphate dependent enzyme [Gemmatimonadetes bacterium]|nr:pyridoxal-phosphate dependent enzyme [Gemmatimonadota bacterium]
MDFEAARRAVAEHARVTPLLPAVELSERLGRPVWLKAECLQRTGSFKVRGAAARISALTPQERQRGIVTCSSGNHGRAVAFVAERLGVPATVFVPEWVDAVKLEGIRSSGARPELAGKTFDESEALARERATTTGMTYISAYDDAEVIAGQGTIAGEVLEQLGEVPSAVIVPLSGGGLVGGIAAAFAELLGSSAPRHIAVSAKNAAVMLASVRAGRPVEIPEQETLANALAGGIGLDNQHSFRLVQELVDEYATVGEADIAGAMCYAVERLRLVVEGGGAVGLAALLSGAWRPVGIADGPLVMVLSGGNVAPDTLRRVLEGSATAAA